MTNPNGLLMVEPQSVASVEPYLDNLTLKMTAAWRRRITDADAYRGFHICVCGAISDNRDHYVNGLLTNSLCIHYLAYHRKEIPLEELGKVYKLPLIAGTIPTAEELKWFSNMKTEK